MFFWAFKLSGHLSERTADNLFLPLFLVIVLLLRRV